MPKFNPPEEKVRFDNSVVSSFSSWVKSRMILIRQTIIIYFIIIFLICKNELFSKVRSAWRVACLYVQIPRFPF